MFMQRSLAAFAIILGIGLSPALAQASKDVAKAPAGTYALENRHSQVMFSIAHLGLTDFWGRFDRLSGAMNFDPAAMEKSSVSITIDMSSVDTPSERLNSELASASVFDAPNYPNATFQSTSVTRTGPDTGLIAGNLTMHNVSKPVVLEVTFNGGESSPMGSGYVLGFHATATIRRSDFGLTGMPWEPMVGDEVNLVIEAMFEQKKD
jgi:polyisoprenoid-binding protein YceI